MRKYQKGKDNGKGNSDVEPWGAFEGLAPFF
jgi:hypothetical protein